MGPRKGDLSRTGSALRASTGAHRLRLARLFFKLLLPCFILTASPQAAELETGGFKFSDELGGFRLISATGTGSRDDPIVLVEEFVGPGAVTLVIRRDEETVLRDPWGRAGIWTALYLDKIVINSSGRVWLGFDMELQEALTKPSVYGDGLSFDQGRVNLPTVSADMFARHKRIFEPYDRIRFDDGVVDPAMRVHFRMHITDPTPVGEFYLVQDPRLLFAGRPPYRFLAGLSGQSR